MSARTRTSSARALTPAPDRPALAADILGYPDQLPVVAAREEILAAIRKHQVVVIAGETGSGKTTQLPKMCLELGLGSAGAIGHTQPRRIAARSVAERIAEELGVELGDLVGYQVRFTDSSSARTRVKVMTDGILLSELRRDRDLRTYDTIIIDEAHERSLNIDFILGYLKALLERRSDLKVIITSATIDPGRFAAHFATDRRGRVVREVPVIEVSGRTYPVEIRYRPLIVRDEGGRIAQVRDQVAGIVDAVTEVWTEMPAGHDATDILVFLSGEREIKDAAEALNGLRLPGTEVLPLYARLSAAEQHRVFHRGAGRRIILATNVAETSLTVPGIGYVVDTGTARISRYSQRTKVQRLPIEAISQASANQRSGRCGRVASGVAIRLYSEEEYAARPAFTEPEILRTSLASVMLQMAALRLGEIARFPFVDAPDARQVADGARLLIELGAFTSEHRLTPVGRTVARLPIDPRMARMLVEADRRGCLREVLPIVAALAIQDPRERPEEQRAQATQQHARFADKTSDFAGYHNLWRYLQGQQKALSGSAFRRMCRAEFLHYLRIREWQDLHAQLRQVCRAVGLDSSQGSGGDEPDWDAIHHALLAGLLSQIGVRDEVRREYAGARGARFGISPGSALFRAQPDAVMAAELLETSRLWGHDLARIDPLWAEEVGAHLVHRSYSEPRWSRRQGAVVASERVTLYGVPLVVDRTVQYSRIDPEVSRELFIRHALVEGDWDTRHAFWATNTALLSRVSELEERTRRRDLVVDDDVLFAFYDRRIPADVVSVRHFDRWWRGESRRQPALLTFTENDLRTTDSGASLAADYPGTWVQGDLNLNVTYQFSPGSAQDGVTVHIPTAVLNRVEDSGFDWQVPGMREELAVALIKSLPKSVRTQLVPVPDSARAALAHADPSKGTITSELSRVILERRGVRITEGDWDWARVPDHLRITFSVEGPKGQPVARGKELAEVRESARPAVRDRMARAGASLEMTGLTGWPDREVPSELDTQHGGHRVTGYPALVDQGQSVALQVLPDREGAAAEHSRGVRRLLLLSSTAPWKRVLAGLTNAEKLTLGHNPHGSVPALLQDCLDAAVDDIVRGRVGGEVRDSAAFAEALNAVRTHAASKVLLVVRAVLPILTEAAAVQSRLTALEAAQGRLPAYVSVTLADVRAQYDSLIRPGFVADTGSLRLPDLLRYLKAMNHRLERAATTAREPDLQRQIDEVEAAYAAWLESLNPRARRGPAARDIGWMIEELRVSLFAQVLGTAHSVSAKRIRAAMTAATP